MKFNFRQGLSGALPHERLRLLELEEEAKRRCVEDECCQRVFSNPSLLVDCSDIVVSHCRLKWLRKGGKLYVQVTVYLEGSYFPRVYLLRTRNGKRKSK